MYPGEMHGGEEPVLHHHLPKMMDDDDDDDDHHHHHHHYNMPFNDDEDNDHHHPQSTPPPPPKHHHHPTPKHKPTPPPRPQQPLQPPTPLHPQQPLQPPTPLQPQPPTPLNLPPPQQPLQPPQQLSAPSPPPPQPPTPRKHRPPPPMETNFHHRDDSSDDDDKFKNHSPGQQVGLVLTILLLLFGITALILWLIYRPSKPHFTAVSALVYSLNVTAPPYISTSMQFVIHTRNPNKRTALYYDHLAATVYYRNTAITPPVPLPPLYHWKKSSVIIAPVVSGGPPVAVPVAVGGEVVDGLAADEAYGVVGFSWVMVGRVRYRVGGFRSGHSRVYVRCDVVVRLNGVVNGAFINPDGQVPLLGSPPCFVDI